MCWYWYFHVSLLKAKYRLQGFCCVSCFSLSTLLLGKYEAHISKSVQQMNVQHDAQQEQQYRYVSAKSNITFLSCTSGQLRGKWSYRGMHPDGVVCLHVCGDSFCFTLDFLIWFLRRKRRLRVCVQLQAWNRWWDVALCRKMIGYLMESARRPAALPALVFATLLCCCCRVSHLSCHSVQPLLALCPLNMTWVLILHGDI